MSLTSWQPPCDAGMLLCRYKSFTVVETEMESAGSNNNGADPVQAPGKGNTFKTLAKYLGRGNSSKKELSMTTPVFSSRKRGTMSFYVAGDSKVPLLCPPVALGASWQSASVLAAYVAESEQV